MMKNKFLIMMMMFLSVISISTPEAYAWGGHRYHGGRWYNDGWFWAGAGVTALAVGEMISSLPPGYTTVYVGGTPYYYCGNTYFVYSPRGYVVVPPPPMVAAAPVSYVQQAPLVPVAPESISASQAATATSSKTNGNFDIYVPNSDGTYTLVTLKQTDKGFIGPQGEFYPEHPTVEKLKVLYAKTSAKT